MQQLGLPVVLGELPFALLATVALAALPLAAVTALALIWWYRREVARSMAATVGAGGLVEVAASVPAAGASELVIDRIAAGPVGRSAADTLPALTYIRRQRRRAMWSYVAATGSCSLVLALLMVVQSGFSPMASGIFRTAILLLSFTLLLATPVVIAATLVISRRTLATVLAVLLLLLAIWIVDHLLGTDGVGLWAMIAGAPTVAILLLSTRRLRSVGPILYAAWTIALFGMVSGHVYAVLYVWDLIGPMSFVREDLAALPFIDAMQKFLAEIFDQPMPQMRSSISAFSADPLSVVKPANPDALTAVAQFKLFAISIVVALVGVIAAWQFMRWLGRSYSKRRASDQMLTIDVMMIIFSAPMILNFIWMGSPILAAIAIGGFVGYRALVNWGIRGRGPAVQSEPQTLLLLRVFGFDRRTQWLLDHLAQRWRYLGPIRLIAGPDAAYSTVEPHEFYEFLARRLSRVFIKGQEDLESRLAVDSIAPDPDGLYRINDFFCHQNTWRMTVSRLARDADAVLMDLRGFGPDNRGCIYEIEQLLGTVDIGRLTLLTDSSTDQQFLEFTMRQAWSTMPASSPNADQDTHRLRVLDVSSGKRWMASRTLALICESLGEYAHEEVDLVGPTPA